MHSSSELSRLFSSVRQAVIGISEDIIFFANQAAISAFGFSPLGRKVTDLMEPEVLDSQADSFIGAAVILGRRASFSAVKDGDGLLLFISFHDDDKPALHVTRQLISNLRNNAMGLKMSADRCFSLIEDGKAPGKKYTSVLYHSYYSLVRTLTQIDSADLLERGEMVYLPAPTDLVKLCTELVDTVSLLCAGRDVSISFSTELTEFIVAVDAAKIEQLLLNLFSNSLQHTAPGNSIVLNLQHTGNKIILSLDDDGDGISQDVLSNIFILPDGKEPLNLTGGGTGLGLYIAYGIAQLHNGVMLIESREGAGTRVRVMLPADEQPSPKFNCPETPYRHSGVSSVLTGLSDVLPSNCFGLKYED